MKIRNGDNVVVISGTRKNKGKVGKVLKVLPVTNKVIVEGVNIATRHIKKQGTTPGQIVKMEKAIDASNVMLECPITKKPTRVGFVMIEESGKQKKFRFSKKAVKDENKAPKDCIIK
ncbi:50S ribosomal protein L24 [Candidatus Gracilibacteria bacterium]|nr:50S ribosomal protein L24 [Candidatus Gracilibacteria bacterium]